MAPAAEARAKGNSSKQSKFDLHLYQDQLECKHSALMLCRLLRLHCFGQLHLHLKLSFASSAAIACGFVFALAAASLRRRSKVQA